MAYDKTPHRIIGVVVGAWNEMQTVVRLRDYDEDMESEE